MNERRAPILILADDGWPSFFTVPVFKSNILPLKANKCIESILGVMGCICVCYDLCVYDLYLCCYSLQWRAAPWAFLCRLGGADHTRKSRAIQTVTGWGRVSPSLRRKQCGLSHMTPQTGSHRLPPGWGASVPSNRKHQRRAQQWGGLIIEHIPPHE